MTLIAQITDLHIRMPGQKAYRVVETDLYLPPAVGAINALAPIIRSEKSNVAIEAVLDRRAFDLNRILALDPDFLESDEHEHNEEINSMSFTVSRPIDPQKFAAELGFATAAPNSSAASTVLTH